MGMSLAKKEALSGIHENLPPKVRTLSSIELAILGLNERRNGISRANQPLESLKLADEKTKADIEQKSKVAAK